MPFTNKTIAAVAATAAVLALGAGPAAAGPPGAGASGARACCHGDDVLTGGDGDERKADVNPIVNRATDVNPIVNRATDVNPIVN